MSFDCMWYFDVILTLEVLLNATKPTLVFQHGKKLPFFFNFYIRCTFLLWANLDSSMATNFCLDFPPTLRPVLLFRFFSALMQTCKKYVAIEELVQTKLITIQLAEQCTTEDSCAKAWIIYECLWQKISYLSEQFVHSGQCCSSFGNTVFHQISLS